MNAKPILFSAPMIRAILDGAKTQTRRPVKPRHYPSLFEVDSSGQPSWSDEYILNPGNAEWRMHDNPYGAPGDLLVPAISIPSLGKNYCADINGDIWSRAKGEWRRLKGGQNSRGYLSVTPAVDGKYKTRAVHRLVCEAFYGPAQKSTPQVRHLDGDQTNNAPHNLDWGTQEQNWQDRAAHGRGMGDAHHASKLTAGAVAEIRASSESQRALAARYGVSQSQIWGARNNKTWREGREPAPSNAERWASRLTLRITDVRVQRLQEISEEDARAEGVRSNHNTIAETGFANNKDAFRALWAQINGQESWDANPFVWALTFDVLRGNVDEYAT